MTTPILLACRAMRIGVLTHNYPRFHGDFVGSFIEASCRELARQGHHVTAFAPYDPAFDRPLSESVGSGRVDLRLYRYVWPERLHRVGYGRSMRSDLALRFDGYVLSPAMIASGIMATCAGRDRRRPDVLHAHWVLPNGFIGAVVEPPHGRFRSWCPCPDPTLSSRGVMPVFGAMARVAFRQAGLITANSADLRDAVVRSRS